MLIYDCVKQLGQCIPLQCLNIPSIYLAPFIIQMTLRHEDGDGESSPPSVGRKDRRRASVGGTLERRGLERRRSRRHSLQNGKGHASAPASPCHSHNSNFLPLNGQRIEDVTER